MIYEVSPDKCGSLPECSRMYIACLFTSYDTGSRISPREEILKNTGKALVSYDEQLRALKQQLLVRTKSGEKIDEIGEIWAPRLNSGLFKVPWHETREVINRSAINMHIKFPAAQPEQGPRMGTFGEKQAQRHPPRFQAALVSRAAPPNLVTGLSPSRETVKRSHESMSYEGETTVEEDFKKGRPKRSKIRTPPGEQSSTRDVARTVEKSSRPRNDEKPRSRKSKSSFEDEATSGDEARESEHDTHSDYIKVRHSKRIKTAKPSDQHTSTREVARPVTRTSSRHQNGEKPESDKSESFRESGTTSDGDSQEFEYDTDSDSNDVDQPKTRGVARTVRNTSSRRRSGRKPRPGKLDSPLGEEEV